MSKGLAVVLADDTYECLELHYPRLRLIEAGYSVQVAGVEKGATYKSKEGYWAKSTCVFKEINPAEVKSLEEWPPIDFAGTLIAFIWSPKPGNMAQCAWVPISAKIVKGKKATCFFAIKDDLINAGADYTEEKVVVDGRLVSAQTPDDLPGFMAAVLKASEGHGKL